MKELKLLPENWKGEIDYEKADVLVDGHNIYLKSTNTNDNGRYVDEEGYVLVLKMSGFDAAYVSTGTGLQEIKPAPHPANSIKLSECNGRHLITCSPGTTLNNFRSIRFNMTQNRWIALDDNGVPNCENKSLVYMIEQNSYENVKVYDMTED